MPTQQQLLNESLIKFCIIGDLDIIKYLVEKGADIHAEDDGSIRHYGTHKKYFDILKYFVDKGVHFCATHDCAIARAAQSGHLEVVKYFVEKGKK